MSAHLSRAETSFAPADLATLGLDTDLELATLRLERAALQAQGLGWRFRVPQDLRGLRGTSTVEGATSDDLAAGFAQL